MKTFEQWLLEDSVPQAQAQAQPQQQPKQQPQQQAQQEGPPIPFGQEVQFVNSVLAKGSTNIDPEDIASIIGSGEWYMHHFGQPQMQKFYDTIKATFKNDIIRKYMDDAANMNAQNKIWNGSRMPNLLQYDNSWATSTFKFSDDGDKQPWLDKIVDAGSELVGRLGNVTQGKMGSSIFSK